MSEDGTPLGFGLDVLITRILPGFLLFAPPLVVVAVTGELETNQQTSLIIATLLAAALGEMVNIIRISIVYPPKAFTRLYNAATDGEGELPIYWEIRKQIASKLPVIGESSMNEPVILQNRLHALNIDFEEMMNDFTESEVEQTNCGQLFDLFLLQSDKFATPTIRRKQSAYIFSANLQLSAALVFPFYLYFTVVDQTSFWLFSTLIALLIASGVLLVVAQLPTGNMYVISLIENYYLKTGGVKNSGYSD